MTGFVHLHVHTEYSLKDGLIKVKDLVKRCAAESVPAAAVTDAGNLFAQIKMFQAAVDAGIKPIVGAELLVRGSNHKDEEDGLRIVMLAMNETGYAHLISLVSHAYTDSGTRGVLLEEEVFARSAGLIVLSGGVRGHLWSPLDHDDEAGCLERVRRWQQVFGDRYYLELTRTGRSGEAQFTQAVVKIAEATQAPVVATNDVCFMDRDDFEAHETRVCIHDSRTLDDPRRERRYSEEQYFKSPEEMTELFADIPEALENAAIIAKRCSARIHLGTYHLPEYPIPEGHSLETYLEESARHGLDRRFSARGLRAQDATAEDYAQRLEYELDVINAMGFAGYFLIVMEFIAWAKAEKIPVGPGRGSGAGSLVAYALGITDLDPLEYDLLFERFLNPERVSMPDFDVDFCMEGRDRVIHHVSEMYGADAVSQIITFGTMAAKAVVRDVARVQGKPYGLADKLSKLIPFEVGMTLEKAMAETAEMAEFVADNDEVGEIMDMAYKLEGIVRNVGRHAGGVVIAPGALTEYVPLYTEEAGASLVSQYDKDDVERAGLVKFDFLGLKTLTIIDWTVRNINASRSEADQISIESIPLEDGAAFELLRNSETTGVFQLESRGMKDLITKLKPDTIDDIIALVALFRPGPLQSGADTDYINRKHGREAVVYPHPTLEGVLEGSYGVVLYQEQVMQIAQELAGFSLGQADLLRRAMGKKKPEEMARVREQFLEGTSQRDVDSKLANEIFDLMEKFAGYAFNKSHSATYAIVSYQTAWLKAHYPSEFMAANLSADMQNIDRVVVLIDEVRRMQIPVMPPSVNISEYRFSVQNGAVVYGLGAVRGVGEGPVESIVKARADGAFQDLTDFCCRVESRKVNKRVNEALICAGAFDEFAQPGEDINTTRARLLAELGQAMHSAEQVAHNAAAGMGDLFGGVTEVVENSRQAVRPLTTRARLQGEKESLGLYLTGHPIEEYEEELAYICKRRLADLKAERKSQLVAGMVVGTRVMKSRKGAHMAFLTIDDRSARLEVSLFPETYEKFSQKINGDELLIFEGEVQADDYTGGLSMRVEKVLSIGEARKRYSSGFIIDFSQSRMPDDFVARLKRVINPHKAPWEGCNIAVLYTDAGVVARISLGDEWQVEASDDLLRSLREEFGDCVQLEY